MTPQKQTETARCKLCAGPMLDSEFHTEDKHRFISDCAPALIARIAQLERAVFRKSLSDPPAEEPEGNSPLSFHEQAEEQTKARLARGFRNASSDPAKPSAAAPAAADRKLESWHLLVHDSGSLELVYGCTATVTKEKHLYLKRRDLPRPLYFDRNAWDSLYRIQLKAGAPIGTLEMELIANSNPYSTKGESN